MVLTFYLCRIGCVETRFQTEMDATSVSLKSNFVIHIFQTLFDFRCILHGLTSNSCGNIAGNMCWPATVIYLVPSRHDSWFGCAILSCSPDSPGHGHFIACFIFISLFGLGCSNWKKQVDFCFGERSGDGHICLDMFTSFPEGL
jgi:hypothetical protein